MTDPIAAARELIARVKEHDRAMTPGPLYVGGLGAAVFSQRPNSNGDDDDLVALTDVVAGDTPSRRGAADANGIASYRTDAPALARIAEVLIEQVALLEATPHPGIDRAYELGAYDQAQAILGDLRTALAKAMGETKP